jgi:hypothetical protein
MEVRAQPNEDLRARLNPTPRAKVNTLEGEGTRAKGRSLHKK